MESEEERAALVPAADGSENDNTASTMAVDKAAEVRQATEKPSWTRVLPTKGVRLVMGSLLVLALLNGGTTGSGWIPLDSYVSFANVYI
jgi:hypothetical protein